MSIYNNFEGYEPEIQTGGGFEPFKVDSAACEVNHCRFVPYDGTVPELQGTMKLEYELCLLNTEYAGRKLWKRYYLADTEQGEKSLNLLANAMFTVGLLVKGNSKETVEASIHAACEEFVKLKVSVTAWPYQPENAEKPLQYHKVIGLATDVADEIDGQLESF